MRYDDAKNYLESLKSLSQETLNLADEIDQLRALTISCTVSTDKDCVQSNGEMDKMSAIIGVIIELEKRVDAIKKIYWQRRKIVSKFLFTYEDEKTRDFIENRYIREKSIYVVSAMMDMSESNARRLQKKVIVDFGEYYDTIKDKIKG